MNSNNVVISRTPVLTRFLLSLALLTLLAVSNAQFVQSISLSPTSSVGGTTGVGTVTLNQANSQTAVTVNLAASQTGVITLPVAVQVPAGASSATFGYGTLPVASDTSLVVSASSGGTRVTNTLKVLAPKLQSIKLSASTVTPSNTLTGTVTLQSNAPANGLTVWLSNNSPALQVPASVVITAGKASGTFTATSSPVVFDTTATIGVSFNGVSLSTSAVIKGATISLALSPTTISSGQSSTATLTLGVVAPPGGLTFALAATGSGVTVPANLVILAGQTKGSFQVVTQTSSGGKSLISAANGGVTASATLTINPLTGLAISPWPKFEGNLSNTSFGVASGATGTKAWSFSSIGLSVMHSPSVGPNGTIYVVDDSGVLYALSSTGVKQWSLNLGAATGTTPIVSADGTLYVASNDGIRAVSSGGTLKWHFTAGRMLGSPTIAPNGTVYDSSEDGFLYAINSDGSKKWAFDLKSNSYCSPALAPDGTIYVGIEGHTIYAINPDGTQKWLALTTHVIRSAPAIDASGNVYVGCWDGFVYSYTPSGIARWKFNTGSSIRWSGASLSNSGVLYIGAANNLLYAIDTATGTQKWTFKTNAAVDTSASIGSDGTVYLTAADGFLYAINAAGQKNWSINLGGAGASPSALNSAAIGSGGVLYVGTSGGVLYAIK